MERVRTVSVHVEVDTNKGTHSATFELDDDTDLDALMVDTRAFLDETLGRIG